jgi:hypothetical protein
MPTVIYHRADFDGLFCRAIAEAYFGERAVYQGWDYGDPVPSVSDQDPLFLLDLSIEPLMRHPRLTWIDHHRTAIDQYPKDIPGLRIEGVAACRLAYQWFFGVATATKTDYLERRVGEPLGVRLAGEYDVWDKRDPRADLFQHGLRSRDLTNCWPLLVSRNNGDEIVDVLLQGGRVVSYAQKSREEAAIRDAGHTIQWQGYCFLALNAPHLNSLAFSAGLSSEHDGCLAYHYNGTHWRVSLYGVPTKPELDFSPLAKLYGGGGHPQACGFQVPVLPWSWWTADPDHSSSTFTAEQLRKLHDA